MEYLLWSSRGPLLAKSREHWYCKPSSTSQRPLMPCTPPVSGPSPLTFTAPHSGAFSSVHCCLPFLPHSECLSRPFLPRSVGDASSIPRSGRSPGGGNGNALQYSCLENPTDRGSWQATVHGGCKESDMAEWLNTFFHSPVYSLQMLFLGSSISPVSTTILGIYIFIPVSS